MYMFDKFEKISSYANKYHTLRILQVISTITIILLVLIMSLSYRTVGYYHEGGGGVQGNLFQIYNWNFGYRVGTITLILTIIVGLHAILFLWLNRPKITLIFSSGIAIVMMLSLLKINAVDGRWVKYNEYRDETWVWHQELNDSYYVLWVILAILFIFVVLAILTTKVGERPRCVREAFVVNTTPTSIADEIRKFKGLLDDGIITQDEFDSQKKELLGLTSGSK